MIFKDINCSFGQLPGVNLFINKPDDIAAVMQRNNIHSCALTNNFSIKDDVMECNADLISLCAGYDGFIPAVTLLPPVFESEFYTKAKLVELIDSIGKLFFRMYPKRHNFILAGWQLSWLVKVIEDSRVPVLINLEDTDVRDLAGFMAQYPEFRIVLTCTTQWMNRMFTQLCKTFKNVYIDTSNLIEYRALEVFCKEIGSRKILFGSNMPYKEPYDGVLSVLHAGIAEEEKKNIAYGNFDRLLDRR